MIALGKTAVLTSMILGACFNPLAAQETSRDVAFVETVTGRVIAFASGTPALLGPLDVIADRTRVDVLVNSELRLCQYRTSRFLTVIVSVDGVNVEAGKAAELPPRDLWLGRSISSGWPNRAGCQLQKVTHQRR